MTDRRDFLRAIAVGGLTAAAVATGQEGHGDTLPRVFRGSSASGDLMEALRKAVAAARRSVRHPDPIVRWTLKEVSGTSGRDPNKKEITVAIEAIVR
jgi:hypothetical protein